MAIAATFLLEYDSMFNRVVLLIINTLATETFYY